MGAVVLTLALLSGCDSATPQEHLVKAQSLNARGELNAAIIELKNALKKDPAFGAGRAALGSLYLVSGDYPSALKELERAVDMGDTSPGTRVDLAKAKLGIGRVQEVIGELSERTDRTLEEDLILAESYLSVNNLALAKPLFERGQDQAAGMAGLAAIAWSNGDLDSAAAYFASATKADPQNAQIWLRRAELELSRGQHPEAKVSFAKATEQPTGRVLGEIGKVRTLLAEQDLDGAKVAIENVLKIAPKYPLARYLEGLIRYQTGEIDGAESALREVQRQYPDHGPSLYLMGLVKYQQGQLAQAEENLARFLAQNENSESARKVLATIQYERGEPALAVETLQPLIAATTDPQVLAMMGTSLMGMGRAAEATEYLERAVKLAPDGAAFRNQLALSLLSAGEEERAKAELNAAIQTDGQQFQSDYLLAMMQLQQGKLAEAKQSVEQILAKSPESPVGANMMGAIAVSENRLDEAVEYFRSALELDSQFAPARNNLTRLLERRDDVSGAEQVFLQRITAEPDDDVALLGLADLLSRHDREKDAIEYAVRATLVNAANPRARLALARLYALVGQEDKALEAASDGLRRVSDDADLKLLRAELNLRQGNTEAAKQDVNDLQASLVAHSNNARLAYVLGRMQSQLGNIDLARSNYEQVNQLTKGKNAEALLALGRLNLAQGDYKAVSKQVEGLKKLEGPEIAGAAKLLAADMEIARGNQAAGKALYRQLHEQGQREGTLRLAGISLRDGDADVGIALLESWLQSNPTDQAARILLSGALLSDDKSEQAISEYEKLLSTGNPIVLNNLAWLYMERGDPRALETAEKAFAAAPKNADVADTYGWILVQAGQLEQAVDVLTKSVAARSDNPTAVYHLAVANYRSGQPIKARQLLNQALQFERFPERSDAKALLKEIGG